MNVKKLFLLAALTILVVPGLSAQSASRGLAFDETYLDEWAAHNGYEITVEEVTDKRVIFTRKGRLVLVPGMTVALIDRVERQMNAAPKFVKSRLVVAKALLEEIGPVPSASVIAPKINRDERLVRLEKNETDELRPDLFRRTMTTEIPKARSVVLSVPDYLKPIVVLDPGHGGKDPGALGYQNDLKYAEKIVNAEIARMVEKYLVERGVKVVTTRPFDADVYVSLTDRARIANDHAAACFVSIHANATAYSFNVRGFEVWYPRQKYLMTAKSPTVVAKSVKLASYIADEMKKSLSESVSRGTKEDERGLAVLRYTQMPAVLIETGFLSNPTEQMLLFNTHYRDKLARAIAEGVVTFLKIDLKKTGLK